MTLTLDRLRELLDYDPATGVFTWKAKHVSRSNRMKIGQPAGCLGVQGYIVVGVAGHTYRAHRLAWFYVHGEWPRRVIDHRNGNRADNRIENLRDVSVTDNNRNVHAARVTSTSGLLGAYKSGKRWMAQLRVDGRQKHLGTFDTPQEAHERYLAEKQIAHHI